MSVFAQSLAGSIAQLVAQLSDEYIAVLRAAEGLPSGLLFLLVLATSFTGEADKSSAVRFHTASAALVLLCGCTYVFLPMQSSIKLILKMQSQHHESLELPACEILRTVGFETGISVISRLSNYFLLAVAPFIQSVTNTASGDSILAQQMLLTALLADVLGRLLAANTTLTTPCKTHTALALLTVIQAMLTTLVVARLCIGQGLDISHDLIVLGLYFLSSGVLGFIYCVSNQAALDKMSIEHRPKLMCILNASSAVACVFTKGNLLLLALYGVLT